MNFFKKLFGMSTQPKKETSSKPQEKKPQEDKSQDLLSDVLWNFADEKHDSLASFSKELKTYNDTIIPDNNLDITRIFNTSKKITVQYMFWGEDEDGDEDQIEEDFLVETDNEQGFALNEFLFKVHNETCERMMEQDATFFEGLLPHDDGTDIPFFFLNQGS